MGAALKFEGVAWLEDGAKGTGGVERGCLPKHRVKFS